METFRPQTTSPDCVRLIYNLDTLTNWYVPVVYPPAFNRIPRRLKIERRQVPKIQAEIIIHGPTKQGKYSFFTGLRDVGVSNGYYGDLPAIRGNKSLVAFRLSLDSTTLEIFVFNSYWLYSDSMRIEFISTFLRSQSRI